MKKLLLTVAFIAGTLGVFAQSEKGEKSLVGNIGYQSEYERFMIGAQGRYVVADNIRIAPDVMFFFPKNSVTGLDINVNAHYVFNIDPKVSVYPLAGIAMQNNRFSGSDGRGSDGYTNFGFNLGAGAGYDLGNNFVNLEIKYTFSDSDCMVVALGYGFKF